MPLFRHFQKPFAALLIFVFLLNLSLLPAVAENQSFETESSVSSATTATKQMIVCFKSKVDDNGITQSKGKIRKKFANFPMAVIDITPNDAVQLKKHKELTCLEDDFKLKATAQTADWGISTVKATQAWNGGVTGKGVKVAVIDSGVAPHEDLTISGGVSFAGYTSSYADDNGHGTHVAGIIGARNNTTGVVGVAPEASLYAVKALDSTGSGYLSAVVSGIDWSISNGMHIINMSLGASTGSTSLQSAVDRAYQAGILIVAAAGNNGVSDGTGDTVEYPARYPSAIAVAAIDSSRVRASFSATGPKVEIAAPGVGVLSTYLSNQYVYMNGTSMATPYVAGLLALLKQTYPTYSAAALRSKMQTTAIDLGLAGMDTLYGYGLAQAPVVPTSTPVPTVAPTATPVPTVAPTATPVPTVAPTATPVSTVAPTATPVPTVAPTATPVPTVAPTATPVPTVAPTATPAPAAVSVSMTTNKSIYLRGETVSLSITATSLNTALPDATVNITITSPKNIRYTASTITNSSGKAYFNFYTNRTFVSGTYSVNVTISKTGYKTASTSGTFRLK